MPIPTEPVGSIPRSPELIAGMQQFAAGRLSRDQLARLQDEGVRDTIKHFEATESHRPVLAKQVDFQAGADQLFLESRLELRITHGQFLRVCPNPFLGCLLQRER